MPDPHASTAMTAGHGVPTAVPVLDGAPCASRCHAKSTL